MVTGALVPAPVLHPVPSCKAVTRLVTIAFGCHSDCTGAWLQHAPYPRAIALGSFPPETSAKVAFISQVGIQILREKPCAFPLPPLVVRAQSRHSLTPTHHSGPCPHAAPTALVISHSVQCSPWGSLGNCLGDPRTLGRTRLPVHPSPLQTQHR